MHGARSSPEEEVVMTVGERWLTALARRLEAVAEVGAYGVCRLQAEARAFLEEESGEIPIQIVLVIAIAAVAILAIWSRLSPAIDQAVNCAVQNLQGATKSGGSAPCS
jgi:hypothetical protein